MVHGAIFTRGPKDLHHTAIFIGGTDMTAGDWVFVPPFMPHVEVNMSVTEELVWLTARTPERET